MQSNDHILLRSNEVFIHTPEVRHYKHFLKKDQLLPPSHTTYYTLITVQVKSSANMPLMFMSHEAADNCYHITNDCFLYLMLFFVHFIHLISVILPITHFSDKLKW